jgi:hypothetical protein
MNAYAASALMQVITATKPLVYPTPHRLQGWLKIRMVTCLIGVLFLHTESAHQLVGKEGLSDYSTILALQSSDGAIGLKQLLSHSWGLDM